MLFNPLDMLRLTFLTGEFREILFGYGVTVISPHSFFFSLVGFRGYGIRLQIAAEISEMLIENGIITGIAKRSKSLLEVPMPYCLN